MRTTRSRLTHALVATALGVYALLVVGATTALTGAASACQTWPACNGRWFALSSFALEVVWAHRIAAAVVGLLVLATAALAVVSDADRRVLASVGVSLALYPVQVGVGALAATGAIAYVPALHLGLGVVIFAGLVLALAWTLEAQTANEPSAEWAGDPKGSSGGSEADGASGSGPLATARAYVRMMKPRLMWLLCLVASAGMALAAGPDLSARTVGFTLLGGVLSIGASGTFNHVLERDVDKKMNRTSDRPLATETIPKRNALAFGGLLAAASVASFLQVGMLAAGLGLVAIIFYSVVYTLVLKPNTVQNTVIGGAAGALPALIGWAAVTGTLGVPALALAGVIFLWTPAHFYNLALAYRDDYERGGFPMMPVVRGAAVTRKHIVGWLGATLVGAAALAGVTDLGWLYAVTVVAVGAVFLWAVVRLHYERDRPAAMRSFHASNAFLGATLLAVVLDALVI
ncbi:protoheme IX farnesyltransferase [Halarchaeum sp. CBA1220]|uniref:heme o synthase n=1 Tax=Halarchaeum sp. CBA1220 TaxID=1853682 RepID=UPI000F3A843B|nr:heme o synthase [Halarchaeum sp. CBA1220]QLC33938.1 protoheme IX farnesyltransferase [Halarchaeum sp. CBA1220]